MEKCGWVKVTKEMNKLISSLCLRKKALDVFLESFKLFSYIEIDKKYQRYAFFTQTLICIYVNSSKIIINNPNKIDFYNILLLRNKMIKLLLLKDWTIS